MGSSIRQQQKTDTRNRILETAYRIFSEAGFTASTNTIAKAVGVSHGTIFAHFSTLDDLLICLLVDFGDQMGRSLHILSEKKENMESLLSGYLDVLEEYEAFYSRLISEKNRLPKEALDAFAGIQCKVAFHFSSVMEKEITKGNVKNLPIPILFNTWLGLLHYYLLNREFFAREGESVIRRYRKELLTTYLQLIQNDGEEE